MRARIESTQEQQISGPASGAPNSEEWEETISECFPKVEARLAARGTITQRKSPAFKKTASRCSSPAVATYPVASSEQLCPLPTPNLPWLCSTGSCWAKWCPTCLGILEASQQRREDADSPFQSTKKVVMTHLSTRRRHLQAQSRRCLQSPDAQPGSAEPISDPAVRAATPALIMFMPPQHDHLHAICAEQQPTERQRDQPDFYQVVQEARTGTAQSHDR